MLWQHGACHCSHACALSGARVPRAGASSAETVVLQQRGGGRGADGHMASPCAVSVRTQAAAPAPPPDAAATPDAWLARGMPTLRQRLRLCGGIRAAVLGGDCVELAAGEAVPGHACSARYVASALPCRPAGLLAVLAG